MIRQKGIGLLEVMITMAIAAAMVSAGLILAVPLRESVGSAEIYVLVDRIKQESRSIYAADTFYGYRSISTVALNERSSVLPGDFNEAKQAFQAGTVALTVSPSPWIRTPAGGVSSGALGDGFEVRTSAMSSGTCTDLLTREFIDASSIFVFAGSSGAGAQVSIDQSRSAARIAEACGAANRVSVGLHYN